MDLYLGIDLGTSYFKLGLFDGSLALRGLGRVPVPNGGEGAISEVAPAAFWEALATGLRAALEQAGAQASDIRSLSWSSQANSFLLFDGDRIPLTPLVLWNDRRVEDVPDAVRALGDRPDFMAVTGVGGRPSTFSAIAKIDWFRANLPDLWAATAGVSTIADYLALGLGGLRKVDAGTATLLDILDQRTLAWHGPYLELLGLPATLLPDPVRPGTPLGPVTAAGAALVGQPALEGAAIVAGTLDHAAAALGAGLGEVADISESTGTVLACIQLSRGFSPAEGITAFPGPEEGTYDLLAYDDYGAGILEWYHNRFAPDVPFPELDRLAEAVPADCDGLRMRHAPQTHPGLEGFEGATPAMGHGHYARAIMTAVADKLGLLLDRLGAPRDARVVATGGGARSPFWLRLKRERLGIDIFPASTPEPACRGAARLAFRA